jgi:dihydropteroate synthase
MGKLMNITYPDGILSLKNVLIMGILNVTPDSFSDGGRYFNPKKAVKHALQMIDNGADIIDIGGESTRPGAEVVSQDNELKRVIPVIKAIRKYRAKSVISIDTYKSVVAEESIKVGANIINDISGLGFDPEMGKIAVKYKTPVIIMHIKGTPRNMQDNPRYKNVITEIIRYFKERINFALKSGISKNQIIIDPGIGFGKNIKDNFEILKHLEKFIKLGYPLLIGPSRKSFIGKVLDLPVNKRIWGTAAAVAVSVQKGAHIIRVHDINEMRQVIKIAELLRNNHK